MDKNLLKRWFNGMYGKLPPEKQLEELEKLKECVNELADEKLCSFEKRQTRCKCCGQYSFNGAFKKTAKVITKKTGGRKAQHSAEIYTCPKCEKEFVYDSKFIGFEDDA